LGERMVLLGGLEVPGGSLLIIPRRARAVGIFQPEAELRAGISVIGSGRGRFQIKLLPGAEQFSIPWFIHDQHSRPSGVKHKRRLSDCKRGIFRDPPQRAGGNWKLFTAGYPAYAGRLGCSPDLKSALRFPGRWDACATSRSRMKLAVDFAQPMAGHVRVNLRRADAGVAE